MKIKRLSFGITLSMFICAAAHAELKWEQTTIDLHPAIGDKQAIAHFKYQNVGKTPIHFKSVHASCGCTTAQTQKDEVPAGEKGEITATFNIGDRTGPQIKNVTVQTDDPDPARASTVLTLKADIAPPVEIKPILVYWRGGEEPKSKTVMVKAAKQFPARHITVKSTNPNFSAKVVDGGSPGEWKIEVEPKETTQAMVASLLIQTDFPKDAPRAFNVSAQVTNPPGTPVPSPAAVQR